MTLIQALTIVHPLKLTSSHCSSLSPDSMCSSCPLGRPIYSCCFLTGEVSDVEFEHLAPISQTYPSVQAFFEDCPELFL